VTPEQQTIITRAASLASSDDRIEAAWLAGSFGTGRADDHSDIDLHLLVPPSFSWRDFADALAPHVLLMPIPGVDGGVLITPEWTHVDIVCHPSLPTPLRGCRPLVDRSSLLPPASPAASDFGDPYFPAAAVDLYFYLLGNLAVVLGRGELSLASNGAINRRDDGLDPLMLGANGERKTDGQKRLYPYLTSSQIAFLEALPPVSSTRSSVIAFDRLVVAEVLRIGEPLAAQTGALWPADFVDATLAYLRRSLPEWGS
jgi:hypothetical protein